MQKIYTVGYYVFWAIVAVIAIIVVASILPIPGKLEIKIVQSGSMEPTIRTGSLVIIKPETAYKEGDVITFGKDTKKNVPTTHRIIAIRVESGATVYTVKGDANDSPDPTEVRQSEIIGKVIFSVPYLGYIMDFAKKPLGFAIFIGLPALYIVYDEVAKILREVKIYKMKTVRKLYKKIRKSFRKTDRLIFSYFKYARKHVKRDTYFKIASVFASAALCVSSLSVGDTNSFYHDEENSVGNTFVASSLIFSLTSPADFLPAVTPTATSSRNISLVNDGLLDFDYNVSATNTAGVLCDHLNLTAKLGGSDVYTGSIAGFHYNAVRFSTTTTDWQFIADFTSNDPALQNQTCHFDFVFDGVQIGGVGFSDRETISNTVTSGIWQKVVINKVYADPDAAHMNNPSNYSANEWVELYNLSDGPVDISGWKIIDNTATDTIPVSSPIPAHGFAVITASNTTWNYWDIPADAVKIVLGSDIGSGLANDKDMLILENPNGMIIDQMNWGIPNPTWQNFNYGVWNPGAIDVAKGHILARIPTGFDTDTASDWHDLSLPTVSMVNPMGGEVWYVGDSYDVKWLAHNGNGADSALKISLWYSNDSGNTWAKFASDLPNTGTYHWIVPLFIDGYYVPSHISRIKAVVVGPENFMVQATGSSLDFCPPIDYDALTPADQQLVDQLVASGVIDPSEVIKGGVTVSTLSVVTTAIDPVASTTPSTDSNVDLMSSTTPETSTTTADSATASSSAEATAGQVVEPMPEPVIVPEPIVVPEPTPIIEPEPVIEISAPELPPIDSTNSPQAE